MDGPLAAQKLSAAIFGAIVQLPEFDAALLDLVEQQCHQSSSARAKQIRRLNDEWARSERELNNLLSFIRSGAESPAVRPDLIRLEGEKA